MHNDQKVTRKLRAILSADVKGYSILMADDEVATIQTLKEYRKIMSACIEQHGGRVVDAVGDRHLASITSRCTAFLVRLICARDSAELVLLHSSSN
jgi:class 3 adenylate cyclase